MGFKERSRERRRRIVTHIAHSHEEADHPKLDLEFWQTLTPQQRLEVSHAVSEAMFRVLRKHGLVP